MASRRPSPTPRRTVAIKRADGEPLTRADIQFDVLSHIFNDRHYVFSDPNLKLSESSQDAKVCFRDLYVKAVVNSPKATKALKDKMAESDIFGEDFAKLALLVNVGRINTTMSFFPEMKTAIRTYHPVPSLQRINGNLQDAPRIKHILKASLLEEEAKSPPTTPTDILAKAKSGRRPSTSVMNLLFVLSQHSGPVGHMHFSMEIDFLDLFLRTDLSSSSRARAFLWLCFYYLESSSSDSDNYDDEGVSNPFSGSKTSGSPPPLEVLAPEEAALENVDSVEEKELTNKLLSMRNFALKTQVPHGSNKVTGKTMVSGDDVDSLVPSGDETKARGKRKGAEKPKRTLSTATKEKKAAADKARRERMKQKARELEIVAEKATEQNTSDEEFDSLNASNRIVIPIPNQYPLRQSGFPSKTRNRPISSSSPGPSNFHHRRHRYSPYRNPEIHPAYGLREGLRDHRPQTSRTMLQHAWHIVTNTDPLLDSDEELGDEHVRRDYLQRLKIISRLRGKEPTPEPEYNAPSGVDNNPRMIRRQF